jgi:NTE family protein
VKRTAFVLGGGGNLGAIQVGMLGAAFEVGLVPDLLVGCSVGALHAAVLAADPSLKGVAVLERVWRGVDVASLFPTGRSVLGLLTSRGLALRSDTALRRLVESALPFRRFEDAPVPLHVVATSLRTGRERWFDRGPVIEPILASAALPAVFPPVEIDGELLVDGGVVDNVPVSRAVAVGAERVVVFHVGNFDRARPAPRRPIDVLLQAFSIARSYRFLVETAAPPPGVELVVLPGFDPGPLRRNDFSQSSRLIDRAWANARTFLGELATEARDGDTMTP